MKLWIEELLEKNQKVDPKDIECQVTNEPKKDEKVLGVIEGRARIFKVASENLRKLAGEKSKAHKALHREGKIHAEAECEKHHLEMERLETEYELLNSLFWAEVKHAIPGAAATEYGIGLRKGWQIVALSKEEESAISGIPGGFVILGAERLGNH